MVRSRGVTRTRYRRIHTDERGFTVRFEFMDEATGFLLREILTREPDLTAPEIKARLDELGIRMTSSQIKLALERMPDAREGRRQDRRFQWSIDPSQPPAPAVEDVDDIEAITRYAGPDLRAWQADALQAWEAAGHRGVVEAITGTGKSLVGAKAIESAVREGGRALVLVPTLALMEQWQTSLHATLPGLRMSVLGDGQKGTFHGVDVLVASIQSAARNPPKATGLGLVVADEVHRYGAPLYSQALHATFRRRLGLTGTYERMDDGVEAILNPYFGGSVFDYRYGAALQDGVVAPFHLALVGTAFTPGEAQSYEAADSRCSDSRDRLIREYGYPVEPWIDFFAAVQEGSESRDYRESELCRLYLRGFATRRQLMAEAQGKARVIEGIGATWATMGRGLVFTETVDAAEQAAEAISAHAPAVALSGSSRSADRASSLRAFDFGRVRVLCAPRILDEGIDVPEADLAVIVAASRTRRQMVQRMGRVIRLKNDGRSAKVIVMYVKGTPEDPALGGHEAFLEEVTEHAQTLTYLQDQDIDGIRSWMQGT